jgi:hypothetical protein
MSEQKTKLEELTDKYKVEKSTSKEEVYEAFDASEETLEMDKKRLGKVPSSTQTSTGAIHKEMAALQLDMVELAETYGKLNVNFQTLIGSKKLYTTGEGIRIKFNEFIGRKGKARQMKIDAAGKKGDALEYMVDRIAEVLGDQYQNAIDGRANAESMQVENVAHMKSLDQKLIDSLKNGLYTSSDMEQAKSEVEKLQTELKDIETVLVDYESQIQVAKESSDLKSVDRLTSEMTQVLDMKYGVLDGKLSADGVVSSIRREILDSAEGVQSAKGAAAASKANYVAINALIDSMSELEIKYKHAMEDMVPVFKIQGKIASAGVAALDIKKTLVEVAAKSQQLMEANAHLTTHLAAEVFDLLKTPIYDVDKAEAVTQQVQGFMKDLNNQKMEWAENQQRLSAIPEQPHYATHQ